LRKTEPVDFSSVAIKALGRRARHVYRNYAGGAYPAFAIVALSLGKPRAADLATLLSLQRRLQVVQGY
jgi:hypothetical protein